MAFFDFLDVSAGMGLDDWENMVTPSALGRQISGLEAMLPPQVQQALLPRVHEGLAALASGLTHFSPAVVEANGSISLSSKDGTRRIQMAPQNAYAKLIHLTRNATHSYLDHFKDPFETSLIAAHDGEISDAVADLALLHASRLLSQAAPWTRARRSNASTRGAARGAEEGAT